MFFISFHNFRFIYFQNLFLNIYHKYRKQTDDTNRLQRANKVGFPVILGKQFTTYRSRSTDGRGKVRCSWAHCSTCLRRGISEEHLQWMEKVTRQTVLQNQVKTMGSLALGIDTAERYCSVISKNGACIDCVLLIRKSSVNRFLLILQFANFAILLQFCIHR